MSTTPNVTSSSADAPAPAAPRSRRALLAAGLGGLGAVAAGMVAKVSPARAAPGDPLIIGSEANNAGTSNTQLISNSDVISFRLLQNGLGTALMGHCTRTTGIGRGVYGRADAPNADGVQARNGATSSGSGAAVRAIGVNNHGVVATTDASARRAVFGENMGQSGNPTGVWGRSTAPAGWGVRGETTNTSANATNRGVYGSASGPGAAPLFIPVPSAGVYGTHSGGAAAGSTAAGVWADITAAGGQALRAINWSTTGNSIGIWATTLNTSTGLAGRFSGGVEVTGTLSKGGGSFRIDHPQDPTNKYLQHSFVESPDMMNVYNGNVTTDANGDATVTLPGWFEALNRDFRYQLTTIGGPAHAWVSAEVSGNSFSIKTDAPNTKVSWQLTGIRQDAWANAHRVEVEIAKSGEEKGTYLHAAEHGRPATDGLHYLSGDTAAREQVLSQI